MKLPALPRQHRLTGIMLLLPFVAWSLTGVFFLVRPGYDEAYQRVPVWQYPLPDPVSLVIDPAWREVRMFRSILGDHLLVQTEAGWQHLKLQSTEQWEQPDEEELAHLLEDAFQFNPDRYGNVVSVDGSSARTDTGVRLQVDWNTLSISQNGRDSRWIDRIYSIHYLEWTGIEILDRILGLSGLGLLLYMTWTGWVMAFGRGISSNRKSAPRIAVSESEALE